MQFFLFLLILAAIGAAFYFYRQSRKNAGDAAAKPSAKPPLDIRHVRPGGVISLRGAGPDLEDFDLVVDARHVYVEDGFEWFELEGMKGMEKVWVEVEEDDELEVSLSVRKLDLSDLGITPEDLDRMVKQDDGAIEHGGQRYEYDDWGEAVFYRNGQRQNGENLRYWDFESEDQTQFLSIECWGGRHYEAYLSESLRPSQIEIFSLQE